MLAPLAAAAQAAAAKGENSAFSIGVAADAQYADVATQGSRFYRGSVRKLQDAIEAWNARDLAFCVHLGDLIDRDWASFDAPLDSLKKLRHPCFHILGNHDYSVAENHKPDVPGKLGLRSTYYSHSVGSVRFLFLDTNDVSTYTHPAGSAETATAGRRLSELKASGLRNAQPWNGAISTRQLEWIQRMCTEATTAGQKVVLFAHHPAYPDDPHNVWNASELLDLISRNPAVVAYVNGHHHAGAYAEHAGTHFLTLHGMVETRDTNAFAVAKFSGSEIRIEGFGRQPTRVLPLR